uniref:uncharacterized protein LOC122601067 n=1 Tax=Erigeron canadensis TaxID=72917 RepID=UPI001CB8C1BC|nr:uncharacterized protein LOC122601067 [Erigeron canadensis]
MADPTENKTKISLKVIVHKEKKKVIFAEAGSDFVDILFGLMTLPLGTIAKALGKCEDQKIEALGNLKNLHQSLVDLPTSYFSSEETKFLMLNPRSSSYELYKKLKLNIDDTDPPKYFVCQNSICIRSYSIAYFSSCSFAKCNDFRVMPNTSTSILQLLSEHGITDSNHLEERTITIHLEQIPILLNSALAFKCGLSYLVFSRIKAEEDFVDFLFGFLVIPLGTIIGKLMNGNTCVESLVNLYARISNMIVGKGFKSADVKDMLLKPLLEQKNLPQNQIFPLDISNGFKLYLYTYYTRSSYCAYITSTTIRDYYRSEEKFLELTYKNPQGGFLKSSAKFMLMDDLVVAPSSSFSTIALLNKLKVPFNDIEEHELSIGIEEGLKILKASLKSSSHCFSTLTDDLLKGNDRKRKS